MTKIETTLKQTGAAYERQDRKQALQLVKDAYFNVFESSEVETAIRLSISSKRIFEVEYGFTETYQLLRSSFAP
ncbi:MAG: hypothetical protein HYX84_01110 [Chloroflexi bacterium]|nr:hypothetical protein [Chloroflexota bacterium]